MPLAFAGLVAASLSACTPANAPHLEQRVMSGYSCRHYEANTKLFKDFEAATGIQARVITAEGPALLQRLVEEGDQPAPTCS